MTGTNSRARLVLLAGAMIAATVSMAGAASRAPRPQPNIIIFLADDLGWGQVGFQGGTEIPTPNLDAIAAGGVNFTQFYVQPACTPTRAALLTGRYPFRTGTVRRFNWRRTAGMLTDERTLADALGEAGYWSAMLGKWHLGSWKKAHLPMQRGFDHQYGCYSGQIDYFTHRSESVYDWHRNEQPLDEEGYATSLIAREAVRLIEGRDRSRPFFFYVPFNAPHRPHQAPGAVAEKYGGIQAAGAFQKAQVELLDRAVGKILNAVEHEGLSEQTLVLFLNDNGAQPDVGNGAFRGAKQSYHEGGIRVAAAMKWPGQIRPGTIVDQPVHAVDIYPTLLTLAGRSLKQPLPLDGIDLWPVITRGKSISSREIVLDLNVLRRGDWKYIDARAEYYNWSAGEAQLYNIADDPYEARNLAAGNPALVKKLRKRLDHYASLVRPPEAFDAVPDDVVVIGEEENSARPLPPWVYPKGSQNP